MMYSEADIAQYLPAVTGGAVDTPVLSRPRSNGHLGAG